MTRSVPMDLLQQVEQWAKHYTGQARGVWVLIRDVRPDGTFSIVHYGTRDRAWNEYKLDPTSFVVAHDGQIESEDL